MKRLADPVWSYGGRALKVAPLGSGRAAGSLPQICSQRASHLRGPRAAHLPLPAPPAGGGWSGSFLLGFVFCCFFFFSLFIVADALHQETELGAPRREMVPIYIGFQEIDPFFFPCTLEQLGIAGASGTQPPSPAGGCSQRCVSKLVKDTMPVPPMVLGSPEPASPP